MRVSVSDGIEPASFPVTVTFRSSHWWAVALAAAGVVFGLFVKLCAELAMLQRSRRVGMRAALGTYRKTVTGWAVPAVLILALISAVGGYLEIYSANPTWGSSADWLKLFGTCFAFAGGSIGGFELARSRFSRGEAADSVLEPTG